MIFWFILGLFIGFVAGMCVKYPKHRRVGWYL